MPVGPIEEFNIDCEEDAVIYLMAFLAQPKNRSMHAVLSRATEVKAEYREYFINKGREMLRDVYGIADE
jgi:hypothetical protein